MARDILYLDQAAAARPAPEVLDYYRVALERCFANQEAAHSMGYALRGNWTWPLRSFPRR